MSKTMDVQDLRSPISSARYDAVVVGAGPYGLSTAAHLMGQGLETAVFGIPLQTWRESMPRGMLLRSYWWATNFSDPQKQYRFEQYFRETDQQPLDPLSVETVIDYGLWFQKNTIPGVDETFVKDIKRKEGQFEITLMDRRTVHSTAVVMAPGLQYYTYRPPEYDQLSVDLVSHSSEHWTFDRFAGKSVVILGGGQGALESAALAYESGAHVQVVSRSPLVWIAESPAFPEQRSLIERFLNPRAGIAPGRFNWALEHFPYVFQRLPRSTRDSILSGPGRYGPMGAAWLKPRLIGKVPLYEGVCVQQMQEKDNGVMLTLSNNMVLRADHVILATGYQVDIKNLPMLDTSLLSAIQTYRKAPILNNRFESSVPGLYFVGFSSTSSCGPLYRFVVGTKAAAQRVAGSVARRALHSKAK